MGAVTVASVAALYMLALNIVIRTQLLRNALSYDPTQVRLEYRSAHAYLPWSIHVEDLALRGRDSAVEWILRIDQCDFDVSVLALTKRKFHASHLRGRGISFWVRLEESQATPGHDEHLPPVPGFATPPLRDIGPMRSHEDGEYDLWEVRLEDVVAEDVRDVWIDTIRFAGDMRVEGSWLFRPMRWLDVGHPARVDARDIAVSLGAGLPYVTHAQGGLDVTIHPFDVRVPDGLNVLRQVSVHGNVAGNLSLSNASSVFGLDAPRLDGDSTWSLGLNVDHGILRPATRLELDLPAGTATMATIEVSTSLRISASVDGTPSVSVLRGHATASRSLVTRRRIAMGRVGEVSLSAESRELDLASAFTDAEGTLDFEDARADDLVTWSPLLPGNVKVERGAVLASGHLEGRAPPRGERTGPTSPRDLRGTARVAGRGIAARSGETAIRGDFDAGVRLSRPTLDHGSFDLSGSRIHVTRAELDARSSAVIAHVAVPAVEVDALALETAPSGLQGRVQVDLPHTRLTPPTGRLLDVSPGGPWSMSLGGVSAAGRAIVDVPSLRTEGSADVYADDARVAFGTKSVGGHLSLHVEASRDGTGSGIDLSHTAFVLVDDVAHQEHPWRLDADLSGWRAETVGPPSLGGNLHVTTNDGAPLLEIATASTPGAAWLAEALIHGPAHADGWVLVAGDEIEVRGLRATEGALDAEVDLHHDGSSTQGAALLRVGPMTAALGLGDTSGFVLLGAQTWFRERVRSLPMRH